MMTVPKTMTRRELIELAALDALGLLDEYEASLFTRSFHHAPAAVQDEVLELQAKIAADTSLMANDEPDPSLRERVIDYVNREVERSTSELKPLATIGRSPDAAAIAPSHAQDNPNIVGRIGQTAPLWRVAAFALCGMVVVMAYFLSDSIRNHNTLARLALSNNTDARLEQMIGPTVKDYIFDQTSTRIVLSPEDGSPIGRAVIFLYEGSDEALLVTELPRSVGEEYELSVRDADGVTHLVTRFASEGGVAGLRIAANALAFTNASWEISGPDGVRLVST